MTNLIIRRIFLAIIVIFIVSVIVFLVMRLLPGDPIMVYISQQQFEMLSDEQIQAVRAEFGLDKPWPVQYINWIFGIFRGDLGQSIFFSEKVSTLIMERLPVTLHLGIVAFTISAILGITFGTICALRRGKWLDTFFTTVANLGITVPVFWLGILLIYVLGLQLKILPLFGYTSPFQDFWLSTKQIIMPVFCLALYPIASSTRQARSAILEVTRQDYVRTAWSKGLNERIIVVRHILKNGLIPVITLQGIQVSHILGGSVIMETVFNIPGMGRLIVSSVFAHDYAVVQSGILISAVMVSIVNLIVDISYGWFDPRVRY